MNFDLAGTLARAEFEPAGVTTLGVQLKLSPEVAADVPAEIQVMLLEAILRDWQRGVGAVTRGGAPQRLFQPGGWWLPGWTLTGSSGETVLSLDIRSKEEYGDPAVRRDRVRAGRKGPAGA